MTRRAESAAATRRRILELAASLQIEKPVVDITLQEIADGAETTVRTVLRLFGSKDELLNQAVTQGVERGFGKPERIGDIGEAVRLLYDLYEEFGDGVIRRLADERNIPALKTQFEGGRKSLRRLIEEVFAPQLARCRARERPALLTELLVLADVYVWKSLRRDHALPRPKAEALASDMFEAVLKGKGL